MLTDGPRFAGQKRPGGRAKNSRDETDCTLPAERAIAVSRLLKLLNDLHFAEQNIGQFQQNSLPL